MKKFPYVCLLALLSAVPALAQGGSGYRYDNFDTQSGVRVENLPTTAALPPSAKAGSPPARTVRPTAQAIGSVREINARPAALLYTRPLDAGIRASKSLNGFTTGDARIDGFILEAGARNGVDPVLLYAQMHQESSFKRGAISPKGASGLMQLMPGTAARFGVTNIFDPKQNIEGGARYMRFLLNSFNGDVALALAGYNAGEGAVLKYGRRVPPYRETQDYVRRIMQRYSLMRDGESARAAHTVRPAEVANLQPQPQPSEPSYERQVFVVKLPDGRLQLVSQ
ncbi:MAG TPA: lytic transglycosylase domain-containing protein [Pyrinomonadaceae bacterium]|jgi:hypothetical protein